MARRFCALLLLILLESSVVAQPGIPKVADKRLVVELVAQAPDIVHPVSCDFDHQGRLLVIESHTHFAPKGYKGPKFDRIRAFDVKTGKATTFFEGTKHTMDLAVHPDGAVYLATRNEILRLRETKDGVKSERIVFLDTKGDYPHNGLSGLCFDSKGDLYFGMGENLGAFYTLIGSDGVKFSGEGDGGHIFHCSADGKKLRRVATGFWNPFGICRDIYGRVFAVDNDPDQAPPCRMLHVVEGGDYGFRFCYGRSGKHPFQSWHGELPGTLPMMTGVGEAPCEILSYESDGLPKEYLGKLMVTAWADHRVELYKVVPHGASFKAVREPFVQGGNNFRPAGLCVAPDGSLYVTDWVLPNYELHGKGAIWRIRWKDAPKPLRPDYPKAILSDHWPLREGTAKKLADDRPYRRVLDAYLELYLVGRSGDGRVASACLDALINNKASKPASDFLELIVKKSTDAGVQEMALRELVQRGDLKNDIITDKSPANLRAIALRRLKWSAVNDYKDFGLLSDLTGHPDPFLRHEAVRQYASQVPIMYWEAQLPFVPGAPAIRYLLAASHSDYQMPGSKLRWLITSTDEDVRFLSVKRIADKKLSDHRKDVEKLMADPKLSVRMYVACATALARIDGKNVDERSLADYFAKQLADDKTPAAQRAMLLRQVPATHPKLTIDLLVRLLKSEDATLKMESVRALVEHPNPKRHGLLLDVLRNPKELTALRAYATLGIDAAEAGTELFDMAKAKDSLLRPDALRALIGVRLKASQLDQLRMMVRGIQGFEKYSDDLLWSTRRLQYALAELDNRPYERVSMNRPPHKDIDAWSKRLEGKADAEVGERIFFHPKLAQCAKCHRIDGRGADVGPDLSSIGRVERRAILESILQPSNNVAPHYVAWHLETADGKVKNGMLLHTYLDEYTYLDKNGNRFKVKTGDLAEQRPLTTSIMPDGLIDRLTDQEVRDLLAYLQSRK